VIPVCLTHGKSERRQGVTQHLAGEIVESEPPRRLVIRWQHQHWPELKAEGDSLCTIALLEAYPESK